VAFSEQPAPFAPAPPAALCLAVAAIEFVDHVHALYYLSERSESLGILLLLIAGIDVDLRGSSVRPGHGIGECAARIAGARRIVRKRLVSPNARDRRIARNAELREPPG